MKARLATILSISGVLVAGSAAAVVNAQVLQGSPNDASIAASALDDSTSTSIGDDTTSSSVSTSSSVPDTSVVDTSPSTSTPAGTSQAVLQAHDAGTVTIDTAGNVLTIVGTTANAGWTVLKAENNGPLQIEVKFQSASAVVELHANLMFGVVTTSVETKALDEDNSGPGNAEDNEATNSTVDDNSGPGSDDNVTASTIDDDDATSSTVNNPTSSTIDDHGGDGGGHGSDDGGGDDHGGSSGGSGSSGPGGGGGDD